MALCDRCNTTPGDRLNATHDKICLLTELISQIPCDKQTSLSGQAVSGMYWFLEEVEMELAHCLEVAS